jgi:FMN-dependent NADH-azoreductase
MMAQLLSNLVSPAPDVSFSESITDRLLAIYLSGHRGDDVIIRLLDSQEPSVNIPVLHLLNNVTRDSEERQ